MSEGPAAGVTADGLRTLPLGLEALGALSLGAGDAGPPCLRRRPEPRTAGAREKRGCPSFPSPAYPLILPRTASPREPLAGLPRAGGAVDMPTRRPAAPRTGPLKSSRSLSGSLCALFSDADSASGMKAELSSRPGVSEGALPSRLSSAAQEAVSASSHPNFHPGFT